MEELRKDPLFWPVVSTLAAQGRGVALITRPLGQNWLCSTRHMAQAWRWFQIARLAQPGELFVAVIGYSSR